MLIFLKKIYSNELSRGLEPFKPFFSSTRGIEVSASFRFAPSSDVEEAYPPTLLVLDSDHEGDSDIEIE